jgi:hypothetical protein
MAATSRSQESARPVLAATPARQGRLGRPIFWVLVISTVLAAIALFAAWGWRAPGLSQPGSQARVTAPSSAEAFHAPEPAPQVPPAGTDHTSPGAPTPQTP